MVCHQQAIIRRTILAVFFLLCGVTFLVYESNGKLSGRGTAHSTSARSEEDGLLQVGEELEYKVSYSFFNLGKIRIKVVGKEERGGRTVYRTQAFIDSNPSLPFVDLHIWFESILDQEMYSYQWLSRDSSKHEFSFRNFYFEYDSGRVLIEQGKKPHTGQRSVESVDTIPVSVKCQDGLSLFFFARKHVREQKQVDVPTFIEKRQANTFINFMKRRTSEEVDAVEYPVEVLEFNGRADYEGVFGMTGRFEGWFSNDEARVPILARMKVLIGSIKIQLERWKRPGWDPPKFVEGQKE